ncbi:hypothetical protein [Apilactobacillus timberlakei]|uniref:Uncharacterized protein n=1 Tax=Apilactobacillus timberlakei TaxID=2008380 RepID=A0ABY2YVH9_9LACO|nr:hypothetical protein [Apilactobacillus timberlakei]TPR12735.1 hypothetical protein DY048_06915 [Apilactobacillus timberlakei]TPR13618.1 hypothetical protein DY052_07785 [Apilactobacillus timberlakei]
MAEFTEQKEENKDLQGGQPANNEGENPVKADGENKDGGTTPVITNSNATLDQRTSVKDIDDRTREISITEKNGTTISAQMTAPGLKQGDYIDSMRQVVIPDGDTGTGAVRFTPVNFHEALFGIFGTNSVKVNGKPAGEAISWEFFDKHSREAFTWMMDQADTFLGDLS